MQRFDLRTITPTPWKNGGGSTRELACWPPDAGLEDFSWRVSAARIERAGPFSAFAGVDRQIMLLAGAGVHLRGAGIDHCLDQPWQPFAFAGEVPVQCELLGGASMDFNLMLRRGAWRGDVAVVHDRPVSASGHAAGLCLVLRGAWRADAGAVLSEGQGLWWSEPCALVMQPASSQGCALAWVGLEMAE